MKLEKSFKLLLVKIICSNVILGFCNVSIVKLLQELGERNLEMSGKDSDLQEVMKSGIS